MTRFGGGTPILSRQNNQRVTTVSCPLSARAVGSGRYFAGDGASTE